jgi:hypothetical protein
VVDVGGRSKEKDDEEIKMFGSQAKCSSLIFLSLIQSPGALPIWLDFSILMDNHIANSNAQCSASHFFPKKSIC